MSKTAQKHWYNSKTIQGQIITFLGFLATLEIIPINNDEITAGVGAIFVLAGIAYGVYGRVVTKGERITK